jgi:hypothetical protein
VLAVLGQAQKDLLDEEKREGLMVALNIARGKRPTSRFGCSTTL